MWQLILANGNIPNKPEFPIYLLASDFHKNGVRKSKGIDAAALPLLEGLQPYQGTYAAHPKKHPLWLLHEINNVDKHRLLTIGVVASLNVSIGTSMRLDAPRPLGGGWFGAEGVAGVAAIYRSAYTPQEGEELARVPRKGHTTMSEPQTNVKVTIGIAFGPDAGDAKGFWIIGALQTIRAYLDQNIFVKPGLIDFIP